jgi:hypothetical protein
MRSQDSVPLENPWNPKLSVANYKPHSRKVFDGAAAGLIATVPMTLFMLAWHKNLVATQRYPLPPSLITKRMFGGFAVPGRPAPMPNWASTLATHFGFGAATGALFATTPAETRRQYPVATGIGFGLCVWTASYLGWVPATRLMAPATRQPIGRNLMMIAAHVVWGATLGLVLDALSKGKVSPRRIPLERQRLVVCESAAQQK